MSRMSSFSWKAKQYLRKLIPISMIGLVAFGGYKWYKQGVFRHGVSYAVTSILHKIPYFGTRFKHYGPQVASGRSYTYVGHPAHRRGHYVRHHRRHHRRRHHR